MNRSTRGSRRSPLWKDIFKTGKTRTKSSENNSTNKLSIPPELEDIMKAKKVHLKLYLTFEMIFEIIYFMIYQKK